MLTTMLLRIAQSKLTVGVAEALAIVFETMTMLTSLSQLMELVVTVLKAF